jgi:son of sevenless
LSTFFVNKILEISDLKKRVLFIKHLIQIGLELKNLKNYNGLNTLSSSLNNTSIFRLKNTFSYLTKKELKDLSEILNIVSHSSNFIKHRNALENVEENEGCIPYLGMFLSDLTFIEDGSKNITTNGLINFQKRKRISQTILKIISLQNSVYNFRVVPQLYLYLLNFDNIIDDENILYSLSLKIEPKK